MNTLKTFVLMMALSMMLVLIGGVIGGQGGIIVALAISMLAMIAQFSAIFGGMFGGRGSRDNIVGLLIVAIVMPIAAALVRAAISRTREFQADATGAHNCGKPLALASALQKLDRGSEVRPMRVSEGTSHLFIVNRLRGANFANLFSTHPPTSERVTRLTSMQITPKF